MTHPKALGQDTREHGQRSHGNCRSVASVGESPPRPVEFGRLHEAERNFKQVFLGGKKSKHYEERLLSNA